MKNIITLSYPGYSIRNIVDIPVQNSYLQSIDPLLEMRFNNRKRTFDIKFRGETIFQTPYEGISKQDIAFPTDEQIISRISQYRSIFTISK